MLNFETYLGRLKVVFTHKRYRDGDKPNPSRPDCQAYTNCRIVLYRKTLSGDWASVKVETASAYCSKSDQFCKDKGRRVALKRALDVWNNGNSYPFMCIERRLIWTIYFFRTNQKNVSRVKSTSDSNMVRAEASLTNLLMCTQSAVNYTMRVPTVDGVLGPLKY